MYLSQLCHVENKVVPIQNLELQKIALVIKMGAKIDVLDRQKICAIRFIVRPEEFPLKAAERAGNRLLATTCKLWHTLLV